MSSRSKTWIACILSLCLLFGFSATALAADVDAQWQKVLYQGAELSDVRNIVETDTGYWVCTKAGLYFVSQSGQVERMFANLLQTQFVYDIAVDAAGNYYITQGFTYAGGVNYGLLKVSPDGELLATYTAANSGLLDDFVQAVEVDAQGRVWVGSGLGLSCYQPADNTWRTFTKADGMAADAVNTLVQDGKGGLWIGHYPLGSEGGLSGPFSGGYSYLSAGGKFTAYAYDAQRDTALNAYLLGDFWTRGIAVDAAGGAYIVRSGAAAQYFNNPGYVDADGKPIDITACVGGRLDYIDANGALTQYTGRALAPEIDRNIIASDFAKKTTGATPEVRVVAVAADNSIWLGTSGVGLLCAEKADGVYRQHASATTPAFDNAFFDNIYALTALRDGTIAAGSQGGLRVLTTRATGESAAPQAALSAHQVTVDGEAAALTGYLINGNNYFKLRDLAAALNNSDKQFAISWDAATATIDLLPGTAYTLVGGELSRSAAADAAPAASESTHNLTLSGQPVTARAYQIAGNNYYMLRDLGGLLDFAVEWDASQGVIRVDTTKPADN